MDHRFAIAGCEAGDLILPLKPVLFLWRSALIDAAVAVETNHIDLVGDLAREDGIHEVHIVIAFEASRVGHQARGILPVQIVGGFEEVGQIGGAGLPVMAQAFVPDAPKDDGG